MDAATKKWMLAAGALGTVVGTSVLNWVSVNMFFTTIGANAWKAGGIGPLAGLLALALLAGAAAALFADTGAVRISPVVHLVGSGSLGLVALLVIVSGSAGTGAFVTLVSAAVHAFAANALRTTQPRIAAPLRTSPASGAPGPGRFCPACGGRQDAGATFCAQCGGRLA